MRVHAGAVLRMFACVPVRVYASACVRACACVRECVPVRVYAGPCVRAGACSCTLLCVPAAAYVVRPW